MEARRLLLVTRYSLPAFLRNGSGISYVVLTFTLGLLLAELPLSIVESGLADLEELLEQIRVMVAMMLAVVSLEQTFSQLGTLSSAPTPEQAPFLEWAQYLLNERPALLSAVLAIELIAVPLFIATGTFNQLSGDLQHGAIRYQLLRTSRAELYFGRFIGMALFTWVLIVALLLAILIYVGVRLDLYPWADIIAWGGRALIGFGVLSLPYVAACCAISANVASPFASLVLCSLAVGGVPVLAIGGMQAWEPLGNLIYLMPWGYTHHLFHPEASHGVLAGLGCLLHGALYLAAGYLLFRRKDL
ncbi:MAG: ABC transporter permease subunit [Planctomycetota bacterium]|jgi:Cu-processing system permease protein